jgi:hypothetical protein
MMKDSNDRPINETKNVLRENVKNNEEHTRFRSTAAHVNAVVMVLALLILLMMGTFLPRPSYSQSEKRALRVRPAFSVDALMDGSFGKELVLWFSDTFPLREDMQVMASDLEDLYGIRTVSVYGRTAEIEGDTIPEESVTMASLMDLNALSDEGGAAGADASAGTGNGSRSSADGAGSGSGDGFGNGNGNAAGVAGGGDDVAAAGNAMAGGTGNGIAEAKATSEGETYGNLVETDAEGKLVVPTGPIESVAVTGEQAGSIYVENHKGYEIYYYNQSGAEQYASMLNTVRSVLPDNVTIYDLLAPTSFAVELDKNLQEELGSSNMADAFNYIYSMMDPKIKKISVYDILRAHKNDYIYYNTDHHWTGLGAYYAYTAFCKAKGITPHKLSDYTKMSYSGFLGTFYFSTNRSAALRSNPDTVEAYKPIGTNDAKILMKNGETIDAHVINDASVMNPGNRYNAFIFGDNPLTTIDNPQITDGSACLLIKESYGNAFAPYLVDHYAHVYVVDYRYYKDSLASLIKDKGITDVIFVNNAMAISEKNSKTMMKLFS